jgi:hypothetical protein
VKRGAVALALVCALLPFVVTGAAPSAFDPIAIAQQGLALESLGRYMSPPGACRPTTRAGWEGLPTVECVYEGASRVPLRVVLLDADDAQLARWFVTACRDANAHDVVHCAERVALVASCQSGAQFPVAGFVDEGKIFTFRDGVTTRMQGLPSTVVAPGDVERVAKIVFDGDPAEAKSYARIVSTTREEFARFADVQLADLAGTAWLATVRAEYRSAWGNDRNRLISARVVTDLADFDRDGWDGDFDRFCVQVAGCPGESEHPQVCAKRWTPWPT